MRVRARIRRTQLLQLQLIRALRHDALAGFDSGDNGDLSSILVADNDIAALKFLAGSEDIDDLLSFVIQDRFFRNQKDSRLLADAEPHISLHAQPQFAGGIRHFKHRLRRPCVFIDNRADVHKAAAKFLACISGRSKSSLRVFAKPAEVLFEDRRFDPQGIE